MLSPKDLKVGMVYNFVYTGPNEAYAKCNGKRTQLVVATEPHLQTVQLFDPFGDPHSDDLRGGVVTYQRPDLAFTETTITLAPNVAEWYQHSMKFISLADALGCEVLTRDVVAKYSKLDTHAVPCFGRGGQMKGVSFCFGVEERTRFPYLQYVYVVWPNWQALHAELKALGFIGRR